MKTLHIVDNTRREKLTIIYLIKISKHEHLNTYKLDEQEIFLK